MKTTSEMESIAILNFENPPIPSGYKHVDGKWNNGFVIERESDGSQFVWIPMESMNDIENKVMLLSYQKWVPLFSKNDIENKSKDESIMKYGGFYVSRFNISLDQEGKPISKRGILPLVNPYFYYAVELAKDMDNRKGIQTRMLRNEEYDWILLWLENSGACTHDDIYTDSENIGYFNDSGAKEPAKNGSSPKWELNHIFDFIGNVREWTYITEDFAGRRGGAYCDRSHVNKASFYELGSPLSGVGKVMGFRVVLTIA